MNFEGSVCQRHPTPVHGFDVLQLETRRHLGFHVPAGAEHSGGYGQGVLRRTGGGSGVRGLPGTEHSGRGAIGKLRVGSESILRRSSIFNLGPA